MTPRVTVLMPVYNGGKYLKEAIESMLSQSYKDFDFLIINDGSTDNSLEIIRSYYDKRIRIINNERNIGQANSLNKGIKLARGEYIVRMDADDISLEDRIKKQVEFMDANPEIGISGTWIKVFGDKKLDILKKPTNPDMARCLLFFGPTMIHPSVIMRRNDLLNNNLYYNPLYETAEDYDLWVRASLIFPIANINEVLLFNRKHPKQVSKRSSDKQKQAVELIRLNMLKQLITCPEHEEILIHKIIMGKVKKHKDCLTKKNVTKAKDWLEKLDNANEKKQLLPKPAFSKILAERWFTICDSASRHGILVFKIYNSSKLSQMNQVDFKLKVWFFIKCAMKLY